MEVVQRPGYARPQVDPMEGVDGYGEHDEN